MKKIAFLAAFLAASTTAFAATPYSGQTVDGDYTISTLAQLRQFEEAVHEFAFAGSTITLAADIDCRGGRFTTGDGGNASTFSGVFDGNGHRIYNFVNTQTTPGLCGVALFDFAEDGATVKNLTLSGSIPTAANRAHAAAFVMSAVGPTALVLENCRFEGGITNASCAAAFVGRATPGAGLTGIPSVFLTNCTASAEIVSTGYLTAGGLVAVGEGVHGINCEFTGRVHSLATSGGLVGEAYDSVFKGCSFSGRVDGGPLDGSSTMPKRTGLGCGGLVGYASNTLFSASQANVEIDWDAISGYASGWGRANDRQYNFCAIGGAAGLTLGSTAFYDCAVSGTATSPHGYAGGFVGWTAGSEVFSNCTTTVSINPDGPVPSIGNGGFAASVASAGALFVDCSTSSQGQGIAGGFFNVQHPKKGVAVGRNTFLRCSVSNPAGTSDGGGSAGFCNNAWNATFRECMVRGGMATAGFVHTPGARPNNEGYGYAQTSTFEDCSVVGTRVAAGFCADSNNSGNNGCVNTFRRCRAGCLYADTAPYGQGSAGFAFVIGKGTLVEDCAAYGVETGPYDVPGFAEDIQPGSTVRRCVGAVLPRAASNYGGGFADYIGYDSTVEDCYAIYGLKTAAKGDYLNSGRHGGFIRYTSRGLSDGTHHYDQTDDPISRCFTLAILPAADASRNDCGSFCGALRNNESGFACFADCYRLAESPVPDCAGQDDAGVDALSLEQFATATSATLPHYDFAYVWRAPGGNASSPYLYASTDGGTNFWFLASILSGGGRILVNGEAPRDSYPIGATLTVSAVPDDPSLPFTGWEGEGFADPSAQTTTYTVRNIGAIGATFGIPIFTVDDWTNKLGRVAEPSETYALAADLDFSEMLRTTDWSSVDVDSFKGKLFGCGHTIRGLVMTNMSLRTTSALFNSISSGAQIRDLNVEVSVPSVTNAYGNAAGLVADIGNDVLVSNCHTRVSFHGMIDADINNSGTVEQCRYYGLAGSASGTGIRIVDCTAEGEMAGSAEACGFIGEANLGLGSEIARCAAIGVFCATNNRASPYGRACGFAASITLSGGATVRECFAAGVADGAGNASGFAETISFRDSASSVRDCYSTVEVKAGGANGSSSYANGIADSIAGYDSSSPNLVSNVWFGGTARDGDENHAFARSVNHATLTNCFHLAVNDAPMAGTANVTALAPAAARQSATWTGFDFADTWSMTEGATTPYFAWSLAADTAVGPPGGAGFRVLAKADEGTTITHPATAEPGSDAPVAAASADPQKSFCTWAGGATYSNATDSATTFLADNHRAVRAVWGNAITTPAQLAAITNNPSGTYALGADLDLSGIDWTPIGQDGNSAFTGTLYGNGHTISNLTVDTQGGNYAGLFGSLKGTVTGVRLVNPAVTGGGYVGALAGQADGAYITDCSVIGASVTATGDDSGVFVGRVVNGSSFSKCFALGDLASSSGYVGGFAGYVDDASAISECFSAGTVTSASNYSYAGGFAGQVEDGSAISDCYTLTDVKGNRYVGGFVGYANGAGTSFARCYTAGTTTGTQDTGSFAGGQNSSNKPSFADCVRPDDNLADVGSADLPGIVALNAAELRDADNFSAFHATGLWSQIDGQTQPYFAWSLVDGGFLLAGSTVGTGSGSITGLGAYAPGTTATVTAIPSGSVFLSWVGNAPYGDPSSNPISFVLDNFRTVTAAFGSLIMNVEQLGGITNALSGSFALGDDIDLTGVDWKPIGDGSTPFTGSLYGQGHIITGLRIDTVNEFAGLFGVAQNATIVGVELVDVSVNGYRHTGALAGDVRGATTIRDCFVSGVLTNSNNYAGLLVGRVYNAAGTTFENCGAEGAVDSQGTDTGGLVGGVCYQPAIFVDCFADVFVTGSGNSKGGFIGSVRDGSASASFMHCYAEWNVTALNSAQVGGFIGYAAKPISCDDCAAYGDVGGKGTTGGFVGKTEGEGTSFVDCAANGDITSTSTQNGGFVGVVSGRNTLFDGCSAYGAVSAGANAEAGGFVGTSSGAGSIFDTCLALGETVRTTGGAVGGFVGKSNASNEFARCIAKPAVTGGNSSGGFVGSAESNGHSRYEECEARGSVSATGYNVGGFVGQSTVAGNSFALCSTLGGVSSTSYRVGGFAGYVSNSNDIWRCMSAGAASGANDVGGFIGNLSGANATIRECFALGDATATRTGNDANAGGFAGSIGSAAALADSYCLGTARGERKVGGFAGLMNNASITVTRCYAAGVVDCAGTYAGAFVGYLQNTSATLTDCAAAATGGTLPEHAQGSGMAATSATLSGVAELDEAGFKDSDNFDAFLLPAATPWTQVDGVSQPYLAWSAPNGLHVYASIGGSAPGSVSGTGPAYCYDPGDSVAVTASSDSGFFVRWTGSTPYTDPSSSTTTITLDNHRVASVIFGKFITTADELDAVRDDLAGAYALGADIDLAGRDWTPIGNDTTKFTGAFHGNGHAVRNLVCTNNPTSSVNASRCRGLFGCAAGATLDGIAVENCDVAGYQHVGALVGRIYDGTTIADCSASGRVYAHNGYAGGLVGDSESAAFTIRDSVAAVETSSNGSNVGGFIGRAYAGGASVIIGCRADGHVGGNGSVGGFVGYVYNISVLISNCVARGDVRSTAATYGGFVGSLSASSATLVDCWCQGAVWGKGGTCGSFIGSKSNGTLTKCAVYSYDTGPRPFCGNGAGLSGDSLTLAQVNKKSEGWPQVTNRSSSASATLITTAADLKAVRNDLGGFYVLAADIDLGGEAWTPIGAYNAAFTGEFYGGNHVVSNFTVNSAAQYAGFFGNIAGGRVKGVRLSGSVSSGYTGSSSYIATGGFAGHVGEQSLVDGCSFKGEVTSTQGNVGGFAGHTEGVPVIIRCSSAGTVAETGSQKRNIGGFAGNIAGGYVSDCFSTANVATTYDYAGGFSGVCKGTVRTCWSSGTVMTASTSNVGAFNGNSGNNISDCYCCTNFNPGLKITASGNVGGLTTNQMLFAANFVDWDFNQTWKIEEGETTPYLLCFEKLELNAFAVWVQSWNLPGNSRPETVVNGIPLGARYVFGINPDVDLADYHEPLIDIKSDTNGKPYVKLPALVNTEGATVTVLATEDLTDWSNAAEYPVDSATGICIPDLGTPVPPKMFFKWRLRIAGYE